MKPGDPVAGFVAGKVLASAHPGWKENDLFGSVLPYSTYMIIPEQ